jgi:hypothetical protein
MKIPLGKLTLAEVFHLANWNIKGIEDFQQHKIWLDRRDNYCMICRGIEEKLFPKERRVSDKIEKCVTWGIPCLKVLTCDEPQTCGGKHPVVPQQEGNKRQQVKKILDTIVSESMELANTDLDVNIDTYAQQIDALYSQPEKKEVSDWSKEKWFCEAGKSACDHDCGDECKEETDVSK